MGSKYSQSVVPPMPQMLVRVPQSVLDEVQAIAAAHKVSQAGIVRLALEIALPSLPREIHKRRAAIQAAWPG
jgi:hypothetical protein